MEDGCGRGVGLDVGDNMSNVPHTTWREEITETMTCFDESWGDVEACTLSDAELDEGIDFGNRGRGCDPKPFRLWTKETVYFSNSCEGGFSISCQAVSRYPSTKPVDHV